MIRKTTIAISLASLFVCAAAFAGKTPAAVNKVKLTTLSATPIPPVVGAPEKISFAVQNLSSRKALPQVAWTLSDNGVEVAKGTIDLATGETETVGADWMPTAGAHTLKIQIDPQNLLAETGTGLADNTKSLTFTL